MSEARFTKTRDGNWGVQVVGGDELEGGATVTVTKKSGETQDVTIGPLVARVYTIVKDDDDSPF